MKEERDTPLGATEFAATLNGDNPRAILLALRHFTKIIRKERKEALRPKDYEEEDGDLEAGNVSDDDESSNSESEENPPAKKFKKDEAWKEDTASYQVPFVGTAVTARDYGTVRKGQWPTGLLEAYLQRSPLAVELTSGDMIPPDGPIHRSLIRKKKGRLSRAIYKAYLKALADLVTAALPPDQLQNELYETEEVISSHQETDLRFLSEILKNRIKDVCDLIKDETDKGRGKPGINGGCGPLAAPALQVLQNIAMTSVVNARLVARHLDEELPDGVLRVLLRAPHKRDPTPEKPDPEPVVKDARASALGLVRVLVQAQDGAVATYICTSGSKERKVKPGILYLALRDGLQNTAQNPKLGEADEKYLDQVAELLKAVKLHLLGQERIINPRIIGELLSRDAMKNICQFVLHAPPLTTENSFEYVLSGKDDYDELTSLDNAAVEARRLLFPLLGDSRSPCISTVIHRDDNSAKHDQQHLIHSLVHLLEIPQGGMEMRKFLVHCVQTTTQFYEGIFQVITFPDIKKSFGFISQLHFVSLMMRNGPSPMECLPRNEIDKMEPDVDMLLSVLFPARLKKSPLSKALQAGSSLIVLECLKLIITAVRRFEILKSAGINDWKWNDEYVDSASRTFLAWLPDMQILLKVRSRFDAFSGNKANVLVNDCLCRLLDTYTRVLPFSMIETKFDWMKLLPSSADIFSKAASVVQERILGSLELVLQVREGLSSTMLNSSKVVMEIMITTKSEQVWKKARAIVLRILAPILQYRSDDEESLECLNYEAACWVDGLTADCLDPLCKLMKDASLLSLSSTAIVGKAWTRACLPRPVPCIPISPILTTALFQPVESSKSLSELTLQVTSKCLLYQRNPMPLVALISLCHEKDDSFVLKSPLAEPLIEYAQSLLLDNSSGADKHELLRKFVTAFSPKESMIFSLVRSTGKSAVVGGDEATSLLDRSMLSQDEKIVALRVLIHVMVLTQGERNTESSSLVILCHVVPSILQGATSVPQTKQVQLALKSLYSILRRKSGFQAVDVVLTSYQPFDYSEVFRSRVGSSIVALSEASEDFLSNEAKREAFLFFSLLGPLLPFDILSKVKLAILESCYLRNSSQSDAIMDKLVLCFVQCTESDADSGNNYEPTVLRKTFETWWWLSNPSTAKKLENESRRLILHHLESIVRTVLRKDDLDSALLYSMIARFPADQVVDRCLEAAVSDKSAETSVASSEDFSLLNTLFAYDPPRYAPPFLHKFKKGDAHVANAWKGGLLDRAVLALLRHRDVFDDTLTFDDLTNAILSRMTQTMLVSEQKKVVEGADLLLKMVVQVLSASPNNTEVSGLLEGLTRVCLSLSEGSMHISSPSGEADLLQIGVEILKASNASFDSVGESDLKKQLRSALFCHLLELIPRCLKQHYGKRSGSTHVTQDPLNLFGLIFDMIDEVEGYDDGIFIDSGSTSLQRMIRSCLKYGIADDIVSDKDQQIRSSSLKLIRKILTEVSCPSSSPKAFFGSATLPPASDVFKMVVSHSKFQSVISHNGDDTFDSLRLELIELLLCCISLSPEGIDMESSVFKTLISGFGAGLGQVDTALRRVFIAYSQSEIQSKEGHYLPYLDEFRWKEMADLDVQNGSVWDWLLNGLEMSRIRATLAHFPVYDSVYLQPERDDKPVEKSLVKDNDQVMEDVISPSSESGSSDDGSRNSEDDQSSESEDDDEVSHGESAEFESIGSLRPGGSWDRDGPDNRYSPAFLLPLIVGALESGLTDKTDADYDDRMYDAPGGSRSDMIPSHLKHTEAFATTAQRLCEKGALSLSMASLCSNCQYVRQLAVSALGLFLMAVSTQEARDVSSWRERPQIAMVLNSVQRAMVIRQGKRKASGLFSESTLEVPKLPSLVAIFLARASLTISRPEDSLYVALNRFFLKTEADHGAFQDMNRLPAFISLFCSSADDAGQARKERMWAVQLLKDGCLDPHCYGLIASCHAPELILTSFDNFRARPISEDREGIETSLLLSAVRALIEYGGRRATNHLVGRMGLLSWLRSMMLGRPIAELLPTERTRIAFLKLVAVAVERASLCERTRSDVTIQEITALTDPVLQLVNNCPAEGFASRRQGTEEEGSDSSSLVTTACNALDSLRLAFIRLRESGIGSMDDVHSSGASIRSCIAFLEQVPDDLKPSVYYSLGVLPPRFDPLECKEGGQFCANALLAAIDSRWGAEARTVALKRTVLLATLYSSSLDPPGHVLRVLLSNGRAFIGTTKGRQLWLECLELLSFEGGEDIGAVSIAKGILSSS